MSKFFILFASLMCISTLAACSGRADVESDPTSVCAATLRPFDDVCSEARFDGERIKRCIAPANTQSEDCQGLAETVLCINTPFAAECETDEVFKDHYLSARGQLLFNCSDARFRPPGNVCAVYDSCTNDFGNPFAPICADSGFNRTRIARIELCTSTGINVLGGCAVPVGEAGNQSITQCITATPFHADCTHNLFDAARLSQVAACSSDTIPTDFGFDCSSVIGADFGTVDGTQTIADCITNPFHADCQDLAFNMERAERMIACGGASVPSGVDCDVAREGATVANWLRSFDNSNNNPPLAIEPDTTNPRNQFLRGSYLLADTQRVRDPVTTANPDPDPLPVQTALDIGTTVKDNGKDPDVQVLNFFRARYGEGADRDFLITDEEGNQAGDASDGVAFFYGRVDAGTTDEGRSGYAGILAGTNLGAVPEIATPSARWNGQITALGHFVQKDFELDIDFSARSVSAFVQVRDDNPQHFSLSGTFDGTGVITGMVELGDYTDNVNLPDNLVENENRGTGPLTGLIGVDGAVGVFIKDSADTGKSFNFAGGFVAAPAN